MICQKNICIRSEYFQKLESHICHSLMNVFYSKMIYLFPGVLLNPLLLHLNTTELIHLNPLDRVSSLIYDAFLCMKNPSQTMHLLMVRISTKVFVLWVDNELEKVSDLS